MSRKKAAALIVGAAILTVVLTVVVKSILAGMPKLKYDYAESPPAAPEYPDASFAVISDVHQYNASLGSEGAAFDEVLASDRKLLLDSGYLLDTAVTRIIEERPDFALVCGDLTKDGEIINHEQTASKLARLKNAGIKAFVVPGNHDVNNPQAVMFKGGATEPVASASAESFAEIYADYGYGDAFYRDLGSLSYAAEPVPGLWLLALDACRYRENKPGGVEIVGGKISQETLDWITGVLKEATDKNIPVMAMIHHGVVEHWDGQRKLHPDYLIEDYARFAGLLASYNVRLAFTGHYHGQDVAGAGYGGKVIYDVMTGSVVTPPCPARFCRFEGGRLAISSETFAESLSGSGAGYSPAEARDFVKRMLKREAGGTLTKYGVRGNDADIIGEAVSEAFIAHYAGDEDPAGKTDASMGELGLWGKIVYASQRYVVDNLWKDTAPGDNNITLDLR
jgi:hypothetical protein